MKKLSSTILLCCLFSTAGFSASEAFTLDFNKETRSLIRKMQVYKNPSWVSKVLTKEGKEFYFVSPKSMLEFYYTPEKWPEANTEKKEDLKQLVVMDYSTLEPIDATKAYYVYGSNKTSPAGDDLPAFKTFSEAQEFAMDHNGKRVIEFNEMKKGLIDLLNGNI